MKKFLFTLIRLRLILFYIFSLFIIYLTSNYFYEEKKKLYYKSIDDKLTIGAFAVRHILPEDFHDRSLNENSISRQEYGTLTEKLSDYAYNSGIEYIYTFIQREDKYYYTSSSFTKIDQLNGLKTKYYNLTDDFENITVKNLVKDEISFYNSSDKSGSFRSICIPLLSPSGNKYYIGADIRIESIQRYEKKILERSLFLAGSLWITVTLVFFVIYRGWLLELFRSRIVIILSILSTILGTYPFYENRNSEFISELNERLLSISYAFHHIIPEDYHEKIIDSNSINPVQYNKIVEKINIYKDEANFEYLYSIIEKDGEYFYTASNYTGDDIFRNTKTAFFEKIKTKNTFDSIDNSFKNDSLETYTQIASRWGDLYSLFIPFQSQTGKKYGIGVDIKIEEVNERRKILFYRITLFGFILFAFSLASFFILFKLLKISEFINSICNKTKFGLISSFISILCVFYFYSISIENLKERKYRVVNQKLTLAAKGLPFILPNDYFDRATEANSIGNSEYEQNASILSNYVNSVGVDFTYSLIKKYDKIIFTLDSNQNNLGVTRANYFDEYKEVIPKIRAAFNYNGVRCEDYIDRWGKFHSCFVLYKNKYGKRILLGADIEDYTSFKQLFFINLDLLNNLSLFIILFFINASIIQAKYWQKIKSIFIENESKKIRRDKFGKRLIVLFGIVFSVLAFVILEKYYDFEMESLKELNHVNEQYFTSVKAFIKSSAEYEKFYSENQITTDRLSSLQNGIYIQVGFGILSCIILFSFCVIHLLAFRDYFLFYWIKLKTFSFNIQNLIRFSQSLASKTLFALFLLNIFYAGIIFIIIVPIFDEQNLKKIELQSKGELKLLMNLIEKTSANKKTEELILEIQQAVEDAYLGRNGEVLIFDNNYKIIAHSDKTNIGSRISKEIDSETDLHLGLEFAKAIYNSDKSYEYSVTKYRDNDNYSQKRIAWIEYNPTQKWYLVASVDKEELNSKSFAFEKDILFDSLILLILSTAIGYLFVNRILGKIKILLNVTRLFREGNIMANSGIIDQDELGYLSREIDGMMRIIGDNIKNLENKIAEGIKEQQKYNACLLGLSKSKTIDTLGLDYSIMEVTEVSSKILNIERCGVWILNESAGILKCVDLFEAGSNKHSKGMVLKEAEYPVYFSFIKEGMLISASDISTNPATKDFYESYSKPLNMFSLLDAPIRAGGKLLGVICCEQTGKMKEWTREEENYISSVANIIGGYFETSERQEAFHKLIDAKKEIEDLNQFTQIVNSHFDLDDIFKEVTKYVFNNYKITCTWLFLPDGGKNFLYTFKAYSYSKIPDEAYDILKKRKVPLKGNEGGLLYSTFHRKKPIYLRKIEKLGNEIDQTFISLISMKSILQVPLIRKDQCVGIFGFSNLSDPMDLSKSEVRKISNLCSQISSSIDTINLLREMEKRKDEANIERGIALIAQTEAEAERSKSEKLLLNILPVEVAEELKEKGFVEPVYFESATIMFADFKGFTKIAEGLTPQELIKELDLYFSQFDQIIDRYNLEKLKTIGDAYMCAGGLPAKNKTHAVDACLAALEILAFMNQMKEIMQMMGSSCWNLRIGIHSGGLIAGVVGKKKFAFDVWGDTVNTASRMESSGMPGRINISYSTFESVKDYFECEYRGEVSAKNKGNVRMYYLIRIKKEFSDDDKGLMPNDKFWEKYR